MTCETLDKIDSETGQRIYKPKKTYRTLVGAMVVCKMLNARPNQIRELEVYKCPDCNSHHIGRNNTIIGDDYRNFLIKEKQLKIKSEQDRKELKKEIKKQSVIKSLTYKSPPFKIVGKIDLSKYNNE